MHGDAVERCKAAAGDGKRVGKEWRVKCPAHEDATPSLDISQGDRGAILRCRSKNCSTVDIVRAWNLALTDLYDEPMPTNGKKSKAGPPPRRAAATPDEPAVPAEGDTHITWEIRDAHGDIVAIHHRLDRPGQRKKYWWERNGKNELGDIKAADLPLYGSEDLARRPDDRVVVTEGEKAADALLLRGILALATVCGANEQPSDRVIDVLRDKDVVLWPDADEPGLEHMRVLAARLEDVASSVSVVSTAQRPPKFDAADFTGDDDELLFLLDHAKSDDLPWRTLDEIERDAVANPRDWLWEGFIAKRTVGVLAGEPKGGKSEILAAFVAAITNGAEWLGKTLAKTKVLIVTEEGDHDLIDKLSRYGVDRSQVLAYTRDAAGMSPAKWGRLLKQITRKAKRFDARLIIIDTFSFWAAIEGEGERVEGVVREALVILQQLRSANLGTILVHHSVKAKDMEGISALRGTGAFAANVESVGIYRRASKAPEDPKRRLEIYSRIAPCTELAVKRVMPHDAQIAPYFEVVGQGSHEEKKNSAAADERIVKAIAKVGTWVSTKSLPEITGLGSRTLDSRLPALVEGGRIVRIGSGARGDQFRYAPPGTAVPAAPSATTNPASRKP